MDNIEKVLLLSQLAEDRCSLNHGPGVSEGCCPASDYLVVPMGFRENEISEVAVRELIIPVCFECAQALNGDEWTLIFCIDCSASRWVYRKLAKNSYRHHVLWLRGCPDCSNTFGGLYFNDLVVATGSFEFASHLPGGKSGERPSP